MLGSSTFTAVFGLTILSALSIAAVITWKHHSAIRSLQWPAGSPFQFIRLCQRGLQQRGWTVEQKLGSSFELFAKQDGVKVHISCRPSDFGVNTAYLRDVSTWKSRHRLPTAVAITYDQVEPEQRAEAAKTGVLLMCYKDMDSLAARLRCFH
jgi:hypothetical protein